MSSFHDLANSYDYEELPCRWAPDIFFPMDDSPKRTVALYRQAKALCLQCPIQAECLQYALENFESYGVWGGTAPTERKALFNPRAKREFDQSRAEYDAKLSAAMLQASSLSDAQ